MEDLLKDDAVSMDNKLIKRIYMKKIVIFLALIGCLFSVSGVYLLVQHSAFIQESVETQGTILITPQNHQPVVKFVNAEGKTYTFLAKNQALAERAGEKVDVRYLSASPDQAKLADDDVDFILSIICILAGLLLEAPWIFFRAHQQKVQRLLKEGEPVTAQITGIEKNRSINVNGRSPWRLICQWQNSAGEIVLFNSANIWYDPEPYLTSETLTVYLDRNNPKSYHVDISFLPKKAR